MPNSLSSTKVTDETKPSKVLLLLSGRNGILRVQIQFYYEANRRNLSLSENFAKKSHMRVFVTNHSGQNPEELGVLYIKMPFFM